MNKIIILIFVTILILMTFCVSIGQSKEESLFYDLIGRSRNDIQRIYPDYYLMDHGVWNGYYHIMNYKCQNNGLLALLVGFDGYKNTDEVSTIGMFIQNCFNDFSIPNDIYSALSITIITNGLDFYDLNNIEYMVEDMVIAKLPDKIVIFVNKKLNDTGIYYESFCLQIDELQ